MRGRKRRKSGGREDEKVEEKMRKEKNVGEEECETGEGNRGGRGREEEERKGRRREVGGGRRKGREEEKGRRRMKEGWKGRRRGRGRQGMNDSLLMASVRIADNDKQIRRQTHRGGKKTRRSGRDREPREPKLIWPFFLSPILSKPIPSHLILSILL